MLLSNISSSKLTKVTSALGIAPVLWTFSGFNLENGIKVPLIIPSIKTYQGLTQETVSFTFHSNGIHRIDQNITEFGEDNLYPIVSLSNREVGAINSDKLKEAVRAAYKIENPTIHNPETTDCVSCHVAMQATEKGKWLDVDLSDVKYESDLGLNMEVIYKDKMNFFNVRSFGYFKRDASISRRVINESAEIIKFIQNQ